MALFRQHRGSLEESLKTTVIVRNNVEITYAIIDWFKTQVELDFRKVWSSILIEQYGKDNFDKRIGWYTHIVKFEIEGKIVVAGFLSEPLPDKIEKLLSPLRKKLTDFYSDETQIALIELLGELKDE